MDSSIEQLNEQLASNVEAVDELLVATQEQLRTLASKEKESESGDVSSEVDEATLSEPDDEVASIFEQMNLATNEAEHYHVQFCQWAELDVNKYQESEINRSLGQIKRLALVAKNGQRICREMLGIPDPERQQAELQMQLMMMSEQFK